MYAGDLNDNNHANNNNCANVASNCDDNDVNICAIPILNDCTAILNPDQCTMLCKTSLATVVSGIYACYTGNYDFAIIAVSIFLTSINYWRLPTYCWRRNMDITVVCSGITYQMIRAINAQYATAYYTTLLTGIMCYPISHYYYKKNQHWLSTYFHSGMHIIINIACSVLYSGHIVPFSETLSLFY